MNNKFATLVLSLAAICGFAQQEVHTDFVPPKAPSVEKVAQKAKNSFTYVKMGVAPTYRIGAVPGIGIGYRLTSGASAADISASFGGRASSRGGEAFTFTFPKANYLYYLTPEEANSLYFGGGLAWGGIFRRHDEEFHGLIANAAIGYEMQRNQLFHSFVQLDLNQPTVPTIASGDQNFPGPSAEIAVGLGF